MAFGAEIAELIVALRLDDKGFSSKLKNAQRDLKGMGAGLSQIGKGAGQVGSGIDKIATRAAVAGAGLATFAVTTAASFETAFTGVEKTVDGTVAELAGLEEALRQMARDGLGSFEELAAIGEQGGALGIALDSIDEFTDVVARLAMSTDLSADQAATALGQLGNVLSLTGAEYETFSDILVALGNDGASTEGQIIDLAARFGAAGNAAGLSNEQILALASTTASMGIEAEAGGGALSRVFNNLTLDMATASDEGVLLADTLGMSLDDLKKAWDQDAGGVFEDLLGYINELDQFEAAEFLSNLGITNTRDINAIRLLSQGVEEYRDQLATAETAQGALREESDKFLATSERQWFKLQQNVRDAAATIGAELLPVVNEVVTDLTEWLQKPSTQKGIKDFATNLVGGVRDLVREVKNADFGPLIDTMKGAAGVAKAGFDAFNSLPSGVKALALAAFGINKVTGGALTDIAGGLTNIFSGAFKLLTIRGTSPANPMWVASVNGGIGGGVGGLGRGAPFGGGFGGPGNIATSFLRLTPVAIGALIAFEIGKSLRGIMDDWTAPWDEPPPTKVIAPKGSVGQKTPEASDGSFDRFGEKLDKLATNEVIQHLARTNEIGLKGVGTSFQVGIADGLDPLGDIATSILARAENPKAPEVMFEIQGHLNGLEEIQQQYLDNGDVKLAQKVQTNIDTLHGLIGTTDTVRGVTQKLADDARSNDASLIQLSRNANAHLGRTASATEITSRKNFDPKITTNVNVGVNVIAGMSVIATKLYQLKQTVNAGSPELRGSI